MHESRTFGNACFSKGRVILNNECFRCDTLKVNKDITPLEWTNHQCLNDRGRRPDTTLSVAIRLLYSTPEQQQQQQQEGKKTRKIIMQNRMINDTGRRPYVDLFSVLHDFKQFAEWLWYILQNQISIAFGRGKAGYMKVQLFLPSRWSIYSYKAFSSN